MYMYNHIIYTHMHTRVHANSHFLIQLEIFGRVHLVSIIALSSDVIPNVYAWLSHMRNHNVIRVNFNYA